MPYFSISGGVPLSGCCRIHGAKNAVLPILAAAVLTRKPVRLLDVPELTDVSNMCKILRLLGCRVAREGAALLIDGADADCFALPEDLSKELRSSIFLLGPVLGRFRQAVVTYPGGCEIGCRAIDQHIKGFRALGAEVSIEYGYIVTKAEKLTGAHIYMDWHI